jgi:glycosyltransferase involved in cell wall biosynthesis
MARGRKVRVLFVNDTARNGGPGRSLHCLLKYLDPEVVHRTVLLPRPGPVADLLERDAVADEVRFEPGLVENPIEPWSRPMQREDFHAGTATRAVRATGNVLRTAAAITRVARRVVSERFDLIYCNGTNADFGGAVLSALTRVPSLWHVRYSAVPRALRQLHGRLSASAGVRRIVCVSGAAAALFEHCASKVAVVHNAIDLEAYDPRSVRGTLRAELGLGPEAVVFGSHGRVLRRKGYVEMIDAARRALERMPPEARQRVHFVVVGDTPQDFADDHVAECASMARGAGIGDRFRMLGFRPDVRPLVADFDVAIVPSVYADPLPRSVIESMSLAKPVIAFDVGGVGEMIAHGTGSLVRFEAARGGGADERAVERLAGAILSYALDPARRSGEGAAARAHALRSFDGRAHGRRIEAEILAAAAGPR